MTLLWFNGVLLLMGELGWPLRTVIPRHWNSMFPHPRPSFKTRWESCFLPFSIQCLDSAEHSQGRTALLILPLDKSGEWGRGCGWCFTTAESLSVGRCWLEYLRGLGILAYSKVTSQNAKAWLWKRKNPLLMGTCMQSECYCFCAFLWAGAITS